MANTEKKDNDNLIVALVIIGILSVIAVLINQTRNEMKDKNKTENNNTKSDKNNNDKEQFIDTSQDYLTEGYKKKIIDICKSTAPSKTYQANGKNFVVIDRKVYRVTDEDYGLFTVNEKCR
jgi:hypothetical protein